MKRRLIVLLSVALVLMSCPITSVHANSAAPSVSDNGSGIVFKQHQSVRIDSEVLNISVNNTATADISACYTMTNTSNQALSVETMFLSPVVYGADRNYTIKRNGVDIPFTQEFFSPIQYNTLVAIENWEAILAGTSAPSTPFGEDVTFYEYVISSRGNEPFTVRFTPNSYYFYSADSFYFDDNTVELTNTRLYSHWVVSDIVVVSGERLDVQTGGMLVEYEIDDIYKYLFDKTTAEASEGQLDFAEQQFNAYLASVNTNDYKQDFFYLRYTDEYVSAVCYNVDFAAGETVELTVSYVYVMGGYGNSANLLYYLTPAKYWKDFGEIEINLFLNEKYHNIRSSSIDFRQTAYRAYQYKGVLPAEELYLTVDNGWNSASIATLIIGGIFVFAFVLLPVTIILIILSIKSSKKPH